MRKLTTEEIAKFATRNGVNAIAVSNFLNLMGGFESIEITKLYVDREIYNWDKRTFRAIRDGIGIASRKVEETKSSSDIVVTNSMYGKEINPGNGLKIIELDTGDSPDKWFSFFSGGEEFFISDDELAATTEAWEKIPQSDWNELRASILAYLSQTTEKKEEAKCIVTSQPSTEQKSTGLITTPVNTNCTNSER